MSASQDATPAQGELLAEVASYYTRKLADHGQSPQGVDWNGEAGQLLRFRQLCRLIDRAGPFSLVDLGCGYGALYDHLAQQHAQFSYLGVDVSHLMIEAARERLKDRPNARLLHAAVPDGPSDYALASGIFNVRFGRSDDEWRPYLLSTLDQMHAASVRGFAFNCLTSYSDPERMRADLYYADPMWLFDLCKRRYARNVAVLHDYGLYEFTLLVRKDA